MRTIVSVVFAVLILLLAVCAVLSMRTKRRIGKYVAGLLIGMLIPILGNLIIIISTDWLISYVGYYVYFLGMDAAVLSILSFTHAYCEIGKPKKIARASCSTGLPSKRIFLMLFGCRYAASSFLTVFAPITMRDTFMPPAVLPAQAPMNIRSTMIVRAVCGHRSKSTVENPVVEMMELTWNAECRNPSAPLAYIGRTQRNTIPTTSKAP